MFPGVQISTRLASLIKLDIAMVILNTFRLTDGANHKNEASTPILEKGLGLSLNLPAAVVRVVLYYAGAES